MNYIFMDMEWNQPVGKEAVVTAPVPLYGEIIRIGAVRLDEEMNETGRFHCCVMPKYYKKMNFAVKKVTGLGSSAITYGQRFPAAYERFMEWCGEEFVFLVWGSEDERVLAANLAVHGMDDVPPRFYDLQQVFAIRVTGDLRQYGLRAALEHYGLPCELKEHDALNDAVYCSRIGRAMGFADRLEDYEDMLREAEEYRSEKYVRTFMNVAGVEEAMKNRRITMCRCPKCRRIMKRTKWAFSSRSTAIACCECREHGGYFVKLRMKKCADGKYAVTRKFMRLTAAHRENYEKAAGEVTVPAT